MLEAATGRASLKDVARAAGVSISTVSNVLNGRGRVSPETSKRVRETMDRLGYVRNEAARQLRAGLSRHVGLVVLDLSNPFFVTLARGAERRAREDGLYVLIGNSDRDPALEDSHVVLMAEQRARGLLVSPIAEPSKQLRRLSERTPTVLVDRISSDSTFSSVSVDDVAGGYLAVKHLLDGGRRRIAVVGGATNLRQVSDRLKGARAAIAEQPDASLHVLQPEALTIAAGRVVGTALRERLPATKIDGIFTVNDLLGVGVLQALLLDRGLRVPDDVAIIGYDDISIAADALVPLSSIRQPTEELGYSALDLLLRTADSGEKEQIVFQPELVARRSSASS